MLENDFNIKKYLFGGLIILAVIVVFIVVIFGKNDGFIIVDESLILTKNGGKLKQLHKIDDEILSKKYTVVGDFGKRENVTIKYENDEFYYLNKEYSDLDPKKVFVSYTNNFKGIKVADVDFSYYDDSDEELLSKVLGGKNISNFTNSVLKNSFDLDGDGKYEVIYTLTDVFDGGDYSTIFLVRNGEFVKKLDDDVDSPYVVRSIIDIDGDGKYEVIVSKGSYDLADFDTCFQIYKIVGDNIKKVMDCK